MKKKKKNWGKQWKKLKIKNYKFESKKIGDVRNRKLKKWTNLKIKNENYTKCWNTEWKSGKSENKKKKNPLKQREKNRNRQEFRK